MKVLILHLAHVAGAIHAGVPTNEKERAFSQLAEAMRVGGYPPGERTLFSVAHVVHKGLEPLRRQVISEL